ncbi:sodium:proton antiporter [Sesbania bispinosa]|nr:sodium:proton antiporter [Sesbania bispinosa]
MLTRAKAKAMVVEARRNKVIVTEEPEDPSIPRLVLRCRRSSGSTTVGSSLYNAVIQPPEEMALKNQQLMADRLLKRNAVAAAKKGKSPGESSGKDSEGVPDPKAKCLKLASPVIEADIEEDGGPEEKEALSWRTSIPSPVVNEGLLFRFGL